jgi:tetratricopeptide (TPR) repeat protein
MEVFSMSVQSAQNSKNNQQNIFCNSTKIIFDISSLENIYCFPEKILRDVDLFWENDKAYQLCKLWHHSTNIKIPYECWKNRIIEISQISIEKRKADIAFVTLMKILKNEKKFAEKAIPHICSFLPQSTPSIKSTVYFTSEISAWAFAMNGNIVINITAKHYNNDAEMILNMLVHELFHLCFGYSVSGRTEFELENSSENDIICDLLNEGLATYVGYKALPIFPNKNENDYKMLNDNYEVKRLLKNLNILLSRTESLKTDSLKKLSWDIGIMERTYYVLGAFMCQTIDMKLGRETLINRISKGPRTFIHTYNSLVNQEMRVIEFELPKKISAYQYLKLSLLKNDYSEFNRLKNEFIQNKEHNNVSLERIINDYGYLFITRKEIDKAIELFKLNLILFPNSANVFDSLAEAYMMKGENIPAIENYKKPSEINEDSSITKKLITEPDTT